MKKLVSLLTLVFCANSIIAQSDYQLYLQSGKILMPENAKNLSNSKQYLSKEVWNGNYYKYLQFTKMPTSEQKLAIEKTGIKLLNYYPTNTWIAQIPKKYDIKQLVEFNLRSIKSITVENKLTTDLYNKDFPSTAIKSNNTVEVIASSFENLDKTKIEKDLKKLVAEIISYNSQTNTWRILIDKNKLEKLAQKPYLYFIEPTVFHGEPENLRGRTGHRSNYISENPGLGLKYNGEGVEIAMFDDGSIGPHIDYTGRITAQYASTAATSSEHGDHVSGTIFGAGNLRPDVRGMAWGANLSIYNAQIGTSADYNGFDSIPNHYFNPGIVITSTSYSNGCNAGYTNFSRLIDLQLYAFPSLLHVFSAGNNGTSDCGYGAGAGWGNVTGGHKAAKNCLTVANLDFKDALDNSSSRGPVHDGRIKPDIAGVGVDVLSTQPNNTFATYTGTSMSCPGLSGVLGQLYHAYKSYNNGTNPNGGLMKSIIMNTADDLGNVGPDFKFGYGRVNAIKALNVIKDSTYINSSISQGELNTHTINVPANTLQLKVMLYWVDKEATSGASVALVNNLNMEVVTPDNTTLNPWILNITPNATALNSVATRGIDNLNNVEQVTIENPAQGSYTVNISGASIPFGPQEYFIVYAFENSEVIVTYPIGGEGLVPGATESIRWDAYGNSGNFSLEYSADNGSNWTTLNGNISSTLRYFNWTVPNIITGKALVRVTRGAESDVSDANFSIIRVPTGISVIKACEDSMTVEWTGVTGATSYDVFVLGNKYMDSVGTTTNNYLVVTGVVGYNEHWVSVRARGTNDAVGKRANAVKKAAGTFDCIYTNDASINRIISPDNGSISSCLNTENTKISVNLRNTGSTPISNIPVHYQINNQAAVNEIYTNTINAFDSLVYTFNTTADISNLGNYEIKAWSTLAGDNHKSDDSVKTNFVTVQGVNKTFPWIETFESYDICVTTGCTTACNTLNDGWINEPNQVFDNIDFRVYAGSTPTSSTGPTADHTIGDASGKYIYLESTSCFGNEAILKTPCIDISGNTNPLQLSFWYHMRGTTVGSLKIDMFDGEKWVENIFSATGQQGTGWLNKIINISNYIVGNKIAFKFRGKTGAGSTSDIALDDINVDINTGIAKNTSINQQLTIYPNPAKNEIYLNFEDELNTATEVTISDISGRIFINENLNITNNQHKIDTKSLASGLYFIEVKSDKINQVTKLMIE